MVTQAASLQKVMINISEQEKTYTSLIHKHKKPNYISENKSNVSPVQNTNY